MILVHIDLLVLNKRHMIINIMIIIYVIDLID